jgi:hypothetical protein
MCNDVQMEMSPFHPNSWAKDMVDSKEIKEEEANQILCGCWAIWRERNAQKHGDSGGSMSESVRWVVESTHDLVFAGKDKMKKQAKPKIQWKPPKEGTLQINTDATFMDTSMSSGTDLIVQDHQGTLTQAQV